MRFFRAPLEALLSLPFYREIMESKLSRGIGYLVYLSGILTLIFYFMFFTRGLTQIDDFVEWIKAEVPALTWTPDGLVMNAPSPYVMEHPELGPLAVFDTSVTEIEAGAMGAEAIFVTSRKAFIRQGPGNVRIYDLTQDPSERPPDQLVIRINEEFVDNFYNDLKPWMHIFMLLFIFPLMIVWKFAEALLYSWIGVVINITRKTSIGYAAILNVSCFALTAASLLQFRGFIFEPLGRIPFGFLGSVLVTTLYLFFIFKLPEDEKSQIPDAI